MRRALAAAALVATLACEREPSGPSFWPSEQPGTAVLVGAGDIGECGSGTASEATAQLLDRTDGIVFTAGDNAYPSGTAQNFRDCYEPSWGRHKRRTHPSPGNHDYETPGAADYFAYFGPTAGPFGRGYYSFTAANWLVLSLNTNVPVDSASPQIRWVRDELRASTRRCVAAYFHHPPFSSGSHGSNVFVQDLWRELAAARVDVVIAAHDHLYERFAIMDAEGRPEPVTGVRLFIVGTGGARLQAFGRTLPTSEVRLRDFGVLKLTLEAVGYRWEFLHTGGGIGDAGSEACR